jgi:uroporphyrinogen-III decarboxylase
MTSRERLWAALSLQEPDRVPIWMLFPRERLDCYVDVHTLPSYAPVMRHVWDETDWLDRRSIPAPPFYTAAARVEGTAEERDGQTVTRRVLHTPLGDLTSEHRQDAGSASGATTRHYCQDIADLEKVLAIPYEPVEPDLSAFRQAAARLGDAGLMMANLGMPIGVAYGLVHPETFSLWTLTEREALVRFTRIMFERQYAFLKKALEGGAGPVFFAVGTEFVAPPMCSPAAFDALVEPFDGPLFELIHRYGGKVIVHHHGRVDAILERIAGLGADAIQPIEEPPVGDCTLAEAKRRVGDRLCLIGSVQYDDLARLAEDELEALVRRQLRSAAPGGGYIAAPTAGPYEVEITARHARNVVRMIDLVRELGRYPLPP